MRILEILNFFGITPDNAPKYLLFGIFFIVAFNIILKEQLKEQLKPLKEAIANLKLDVENLKLDVEKLNHKFRHIENFCIKVSEFLKYQFPKKFTSIYKELEEKRSPTRLSNLGDKILNDSGIKKFIDNNLGYLSIKLEKENPSTAFDVENDAFEVLLGEADHQDLKDTKNWLYENPEYEDSKGEKFVVDMIMVMRIGRLYLRDKFLNTHPELLV